MNLAPRSAVWSVISFALAVSVAASGQTTQPSAPPPATSPAHPAQPPAQGGFQIVPPRSAFDVAPPGVEEALKDRAAKFFQCYVDDKVRRSEEFVVPDERDAYYTIQKPHYFGFKILDVTFKDNYTRANVVVLINQEIAIPGQSVIRANIPRPSYWVLLDGVWYYTMSPVKPGEIEHTPFGDRIAPDPKDQRPQVLFTGDELKNRIDQAMKAKDQLDRAPQASKPVAELTSGTNYSDEIVITNSGATAYHFHVAGVSLPPALLIEPTQGEVKANGSIRLKFSMPPEAAAKIGSDYPKVMVVMDGTPIAVTLGVKILGPGVPNK